MVKQDKLRGYYYPSSLLFIVFGTAMIIGWDAWLLDLYGIFILVMGVALNVVLMEEKE